MENVYFEDDAGVSPQWLTVRVRVQGGLIPAYGDPFPCCCQVPLRASFAPVPAKQGMAICFFDMENVYFDDYAGVSPQWLAVRVRLQGGLIPALYLYSDLN